MTRSKARAAGAVYLLYFALVIGATASVGRIAIGLSDVANNVDGDQEIVRLAGQGYCV